MRRNMRRFLFNASEPDYILIRQTLGKSYVTCQNKKQIKMANKKDTNDTGKGLNLFIYIVMFQAKMLVVRRKCCNQNADGGILLYRYFHSHFFDKTNLSVTDSQAE